MTVVDAAGTPVSDADIVAVCGYEILSQRRTGGDGRAQLLVPADAPLDHVLASKRGVGLDYVLYHEPGALNSDLQKRPAGDRAPLRFVLNGVLPMTIRVTDADGTPLPKVTVWPWIFIKPDHGGMVNLAGGTTMPDFEAVTDADGRATFAIVPVDNADVVEFWTKRDGYFTPRRCVVQPKTFSGEATVRMVRRTTAKGRTVFADGRPAPGIPVTAIGFCGGEHFDAKAVSGADGGFELDIVPEMYYLIVAGNKEWASAEATRVIRSGMPIEPIVLTVEPARRVFGRVTMGSDQTPLADVWATLYQIPLEDYYRLPAAKRLPDGPPEASAVHPLYARWLKTDAQGRFEHFVGPGKYYIIGPSNANVPKFVIEEQPFVEANLHADRPEWGTISGRVVRRDNPSQPVPGARVRVALTDRPGTVVDAGADSNGRFSAEVRLGNMLVFAASNNGKLSGIARCESDRHTDVTVAVGPSASARGRLIDARSRQPLAGQELCCSVQVAFPNDTFTNYFESTTTTDDRGDFIIPRLAVGCEYDLEAVVRRNTFGTPDQWMPLIKITADDAKEIALGDVGLEPTRTTSLTRACCWPNCNNTIPRSPTPKCSSPRRWRKRRPKGRTF